MAARALLLILWLVAGIAAISAQPSQDSAALTFPDLLRTTAIEDPLAVFSFVLRNLPDQVKVYPSENYFYLRFNRGGTSYTGNVRLAAADRDQGKLHFAYGVAPTDRVPSPRLRHVVLDERKGVTVSRTAPNSYRVTHHDKSVLFVLNDLSQARPPDGLLRLDERFIGAIFDESAVRFFLVFNPRLKAFHYLLDETVSADEWVDAGHSLVIGKRTGFAFYRDGARKVLVGVSASNSRLNTAYDGPFDQLPENQIEGDTLRDAIVAADPSARGKIDRFGNFSDGSGRYLIHPYLLYKTFDDLAVFHRCATAKSVLVSRHALCFVISNEEAAKRKPLPLALKRR